MGIIRAFTGALAGTFADQWKEIVTAGVFNEHTLVGPGLLIRTNNGRGVNHFGSVDVLSNGSKILVPENAAAVIFSSSGVQDIIAQPGGYEYHSGIPSFFNGDGISNSFLQQTSQRIGYGGQTPERIHVVFVNLREIRGIKFGTRSPIMYHDRSYGVDLEIVAHGTYSLRVVDVLPFIRGFLPPNARQLVLSTTESRRALNSEFLQSFISMLNSMSTRFRASELPSQLEAIGTYLADNESPLGSWIPRFGLDIVRVGIESVEFTPASRELIKQFADKRMTVSAYEGISQQASNIGAQQNIALGVREHGLGDGGGMLFGMNMAQGLNPQNVTQVNPVGAVSEQPNAAATTQASNSVAHDLDRQVSMLEKLKGLVDAGVITPEEFAAKKKQILDMI